MNEPVLVTPVDGADRRRVLKLAVGGLLVVLLVAFVLPKVLFGGGDDAAEDDAAATLSAPPVTTPEATPSNVIETVGSFSAKDPFSPVVADAPVATTPPAPTVDVPAPAPAPEPTVVDAPDAGTPSGGSSGAGAPPITAPAPRAVHTFALHEIYTDGAGLAAARVAVDGQEHQVAIGQDFAGSYRVLSLDRSNLCGVFLYGDRRFSLCQGEETQT